MVEIRAQNNFSFHNLVKKGSIAKAKTHSALSVCEIVIKLLILVKDSKKSTLPKTHKKL